MRPAALRRAAAAFLAFACLAAGAQGITVGGTGAGLGTMQLLGAESVRAGGAAVAIVANLGSSGGLKALQAGAIDVAITSRDLRPEEKAAGLLAHAYGRTPFLLATGERTTAGPTGVADLPALYAGTRLQWQDGSPVRVILRPPHDGDWHLLAGFSPAMRKALEAASARPGMIVASTDQDAADAIERTPGAIGTTSLALLLSERRQLRPLALDGVQPTAANVGNGTYPYSKAMYMVRRADARPDVVRFVELVNSPRGRRILEANGHWVAGSAR